MRIDRGGTPVYCWYNLSIKTRRTEITRVEMKRGDQNGDELEKESVRETLHGREMVLTSYAPGS